MFHNNPSTGTEVVELDELSDRWTDTWTLIFDFIIFHKLENGLNKQNTS